MKKILFLITDLERGGAEKNLFNLVLNLPQEEFLPCVVSLSGEGFYGKKLREKGVRVYSLYMKGKNLPHSLSKLRKILKEFSPHILHTFLFHANLAGRIMGRLCGVPVVISSVRVMEKEKLWHLLLERITRGLIDREIEVCQALREFRRKTIGLSENKMVVIYNGLEEVSWEDVPAIPREKLGIPPSGFLIGTLSRLTLQKGLPYLILAMKIVLKRIPFAYLIIAGKGEKESELKGMVRRLGIEERVKFRGFEENPLSFLRSLDLFVLPSLWEGLPNSLLEAQALGIPAVVTDVGGNPEIVKDGETGIVVPSRDSISLAGGIIYLGENKAIRLRMGEKAKRVREIFPLRRMIEEHLILYRELLPDKFSP